MPSSTTNPICVRRSRSSSGSGLRRTASATRNTTCPPSRIGIGSRLRIARLIEKNAMKRSSQSRPSRAACPDACATRMGPPSSRTEIWPSISPLRKPRMIVAVRVVSCHPLAIASPGGLRTRVTPGCTCAPMKP